MKIVKTVKIYEEIPPEFEEMIEQKVRERSENDELFSEDKWEYKRAWAFRELYGSPDCEQWWIEY